MDIEFYEKGNGDKPAQEYIVSLNVKLRAKTLRVIEMLRVNGYNLRLPHSELIDDGIFELRAKVGSDITRVMYFFIVGETAVLTNGFTKKTGKTPKSEIELAKKYRADYMKQKGADYNDKL